MPGISFQAQESPVIFDARKRLHATESWAGGPRLVIIAWTVIHFRTLEESVQLELRERRFPLPNNESPRIPESPMLTPLTRTNQLPPAWSSHSEPEPKKRRTELESLFGTASRGCTPWQDDGVSHRLSPL